MVVPTLQVCRDQQAVHVLSAEGVQAVVGERGCGDSREEFVAGLERLGTRATLHVYCRDCTNVDF